MNFKMDLVIRLILYHLIISRKALVALDCSSSSSCCSRALGSTSAPPDTDPAFAALKAPGIFHPGGPAELEQRKPSHEVVSCGQRAGGLQEGQMRCPRERRLWQGMWVR